MSGLGWLAGWKWLAGMAGGISDDLFGGKNSAFSLVAFPSRAFVIEGITYSEKGKQ